MQIKDIGEHQLLAIINQYCDRTKNGDDGAIISISSEKQLVISTDVLVENVHFSDITTPPLSVGYRAIAVNISDIVAMGGTPKVVTVGLSLRKDTDVSWVEAVYQGMQQCLSSFDCSIVGGDITRSQVNTIAITILGEVRENQAIYRHTAQVGDSIVITGFHGLARAGLEMLLYPEKYKHISPQTRKKVIFAHQYPQPRLDVIKALSSIKPFPRISGMDSSDGLADAIIQICQASKKGSIVHFNKIPIASELLEIDSFDTILDWVLYGGEDFELVLTMDSSIASYLQEKNPHQYYIIGEITNDCGVELRDENNSYPKLLLTQKRSFQHF